MKTMDMEIIEFFDQLIRQSLRKARRKQKMNDVLFSVLHLVTKAVLLRLGKDIGKIIRVHCISFVVHFKT